MRNIKNLLATVLIIAIVISIVPVTYGAELPDYSEHTHQYISQVISDVSHTEDGITLYTCSCGDSYEEVTPAEDHNYVVIEDTEPTQDEDGVTVYSCSVCGDSYTVTKEYQDEYVAKMYICAKREFSPLGHMWVYIENNSDQPIEVGAYTVPVDQGVSIGTFGLTRWDGFGIYYNIEAYSANKYGLENIVCIEENLTETKLEKVSKTVRNINFWEPIFFNCMGIAFTIWNAGATIKLIPLIFPLLGRIQMLLYPNTDTINMYYPTEDQVFKQRGIGNNATLENVNSHSLSYGI